MFWETLVKVWLQGKFGILLSGRHSVFKKSIGNNSDPNHYLWHLWTMDFEALNNRKNSFQIWWRGWIGKKEGGNSTSCFFFFSPQTYLEDCWKILWIYFFLLPKLLFKQFYKEIYLVGYSLKLNLSKNYSAFLGLKPNHFFPPKIIL